MPNNVPAFSIFHGFGCMLMVSHYRLPNLRPDLEENSILSMRKPPPTENLGA